MNTIKKLVNIVFFLSLALKILFFFYKPPLPDKSEIIPEVVNLEPIQEKVEIEPMTLDLEGLHYQLAPRFSYELYGLIVSQYDSDNWLDYTHKQDPGNIKDICVVWGENIKNGTYRKVEYTSGEFTCFYRWKEKLEPPFSNVYGSNNHLIPANDTAAATIKGAAIGDQIHLKGYLVNYSIYKNKEKIFQRSTSIKREDSGSGACEILYVEEFEILKESNLIYRFIKKSADITLLLSFIISVLFFFKS